MFKSWETKCIDNSYHDTMHSVRSHLLHCLKRKCFRNKIKGEFSTYLVLKILHRLRIIIMSISKIG